MEMVRKVGLNEMPKPLESSESSADVERLPGWIKVGAVAAASALVGGLAAAWWYRKTLAKLHQAGESTQNSKFRISAEPPDDEI
jgi:hypothetical protein